MRPDPPTAAALQWVRSQKWFHLVLEADTENEDRGIEPAKFLGCSPIYLPKFLPTTVWERHPRQIKKMKIAGRDAKTKQAPCFDALYNAMIEACACREDMFDEAVYYFNRMEAEGHIRRIRDGMGKRVELKEVEI